MENIFFEKSLKNSHKNKPRRGFTRSNPLAKYESATVMTDFLSNEAGNTLLRLTSRGSSIIAELFHLSEVDCVCVRGGGKGQLFGVIVIDFSLCFLNYFILFLNIEFNLLLNFKQKWIF